MIDIRTELKHMKTSVMASEVTLRFLEQSEKSFFLHIITHRNKRQRERERERETERERERERERESEIDP